MGWKGKKRVNETSQEDTLPGGRCSQVDLVVPVAMEDEDGLEGSLEVEGIGLLMDGQ